MAPHVSKKQDAKVAAVGLVDIEDRHTCRPSRDTSRAYACVTLLQVLSLQCSRRPFLSQPAYLDRSLQDQLDGRIHRESNRELAKTHYKLAIARPPHVKWFCEIQYSFTRARTHPQLSCCHQTPIEGPSMTSWSNQRPTAEAAQAPSASRNAVSR